MPKIVIIGAGISGIITANSLAGKGHDVTVVSSTSYFEWAIAGTYSLTRPEELQKAVSGQITLKKGATLVVGIAVSMQDNQVTLQDGKTLPFDALIVATGLDLPLFRPKVGQSWDDRRKEVTEVGNAVRKASHVVIGGGGAIGVEFAGDVREVNPSAKITLVCSRDRALPYLNDKYKAKLEQKFKELNITVLPNEKVAEEEYSITKKELKLSSGKTLDSDCFIPAFTKGFGAGWTGLADGSGKVPVNNYLQCESKKSVFAVGCSTKSVFSAMPKIDAESKTVCKNVLLFLKDSPLKDHVEGMPTASQPMAQKIGTTTYAWFDPAQLPGPAAACCRACGFPCFPLILCWPLGLCGVGPCHPCCCGYCCGDPEGKGTATALTLFLHSSGPAKLKMGTPPAQEQMK